MTVFKSIALVALLLLGLAAPGSAKSIWQEINESAPLQPIFEDLRNSAP